MEIDKQTIKALSADARIRILKMLRENRRIAADMAKELGLAPSTINEHLKTMKSAGLVRKRDTGHKWIYYEITEKGTGLIKPKAPVQFILALSLGILMAFFGILNAFLYSATSMQQQAEKMASSATNAITESSPAAASGASALTASTLDWLSIAVAMAGVALVILSLYRLMRQK